MAEVVVIETITVNSLLCEPRGQQTCCVFELGEKTVVSQKKAIDGAVEDSAVL